MTGATGPQPSALGPFVGISHVRQAVKATLERWAPFYLAEANRQTGLELPPFNDFVNEPLTAPGTVSEAPRYVVSVPGTLGAPTRKGDGTYRAVFDVRVELWMWGADYQDTEDKLGFYAIALRELLVQQPSLGGLAESVVWRGERYAQAGPPTAFRTWGQSSLQFAVTVDGVVNAFAGPASPPLDPTATPTSGPRVTSTSVTVQALPD